MKEFIRSRVVAPLILNLGVVNFKVQPVYPRERTMIPIEQEPGWAPLATLSICTREKPLSHAWIRTPDCPVRSLFTIPITGFHKFWKIFTPCASNILTSRVELVYNVMKGTEYFVAL
jgi:hypothetical protein